MYKISEELKVLNLLASTIIVADYNAPGVDVETYESDALAIVTTGLVASTNCTYVVNIQGSTASAGAYTTIASFDSFDSSDDYKVGAIAVNLGNASTYKYVRAQVDATLAAGGATISAIVGVTLLVRPTVAASGINSADIA
jgi:hypothetical protein